MNYTECEEYISGIPKFTSNIDKTKEIVKRILKNNTMPKVIHVAGTNGKGSVCTYIESVLLEAGISVGKFTSPHLVTMRERIAYNGRLISEDEFVKAFLEVEKTAREVLYTPNYFEYTLLMAISFYISQKPEYIILETGLGGRMDQTNFITDEKIAVITEIGLDHMAYLGDTYEKIAMEKAGIIKEGNQVVYLDKRAKSSAIIEQEAEHKNAGVIRVSDDNILNKRFLEDKLCFDYATEDGYLLQGIVLNTSALYQMENAAVAVAVLNLIKDDRISKQAILNGLKEAKWPGRMEKLSSGVYLDGAHNEDGIQAFLDSVKTMKRSGTKCSLLFGVVADKEYKKIVSMLVNSRLFNMIYAVKLDTDRSTSMEVLKQAFSEYNNQQVEFFENVKDGYSRLIKDNGLMFAAGSLYLVGQIKELCEVDVK